MADKISALPAATLPLAGTELLPVVQSGVTKNVPASALGGGDGSTFQYITTATSTTDLTFPSTPMGIAYYCTFFVTVLTDGAETTVPWVFHVETYDASNTFRSVDFTPVQTPPCSGIFHSATMSVQAAGQLTLQISAEPDVTYDVILEYRVAPFTP